MGLINPFGTFTNTLDNLYTVRYNWRMDNREIILERALLLFAERGYDAVGVQELCEAAGVTKPTLYHYFGSKQGLLDALLEQYFTPLLSRVQSAAAYRHDVPLTLTQVATAYFQFAAQYPIFYRLQLSMFFAAPASDSHRAVIGYRSRLDEILQNLFLAAAEDHGNMKGRHKAYALTFAGMIESYISLSLYQDTLLDNHGIYRAVHQFMHGIFS